MQAELALLHGVVDGLTGAGLDVRLIGGWAEEILGLARPGPHRDIDLLVIDADPQDLDAFLAGQDEVALKHLPHKRAYVVNGVVVELLLVSRGPNGAVTHFWDEHSFHWPASIKELSDVAGLPVPLRRSWPPTPRPTPTWPGATGTTTTTPMRTA